MNTRLAVLLIALAMPALSGCGNKGALVRATEPELTGVPGSTPAEDADATSDESAVEPAASEVTPAPAEPAAADPAEQPTVPEVPPAQNDDGEDGTE